jgi:hypothetical protein
MQQPVVETEDWDDAVVGLERGAKRRMVANPQVAAKPDESRTAIAEAGGRSGAPPPLRRLTQTILATRTTSFAGTS